MLSKLLNSESEDVEFINLLLIYNRFSYNDDDDDGNRGDDDDYDENDYDS